MKEGKNCIQVAVCWFCHDGQGSFVMQKRNENCRDEQGRWDTGGGALEFGEEFEERLKKEIKEELGAEIIEKEFLGFRNVIRGKGDQRTHWITFDYKVLVDREKVINRELHKFDEIGWFDFNNLPSPLHSQLPEFFKKYKNKL